jgi:hypothetical protein
METPVLWAFAEDVKTRTWADWLLAHTSFLKPLHRYEGMLTIHADRLQFVGWDKRNAKEVSLEIYKYQITQLFHGFDKVFSIMETRGLGLGGWPLRVTFMQNNSEENLYLITNFRFGWWSNKECFEFLKMWLAK